MPSFGFGLTLPKQIAECFASFTPPVAEPCMSMLEKPTHRAPYSDNAQEFLPIPPSLDTLHGQPPIFDHSPGHPSASVDLISFSDQDTFRNEYECDNISEDFFDPLVMPLQLQHQLQQIQQPATIPAMLYPGLGANWDETRPLAYEDVVHENSFDSSIFLGQHRSHLLIDHNSDHSYKSQSPDSEEKYNEQNSKPTPRRPFRNHHDRQQTAETRKLTACIRCRMQRIRCIVDPENPTGVCLTCKKVLRPKLCKGPCLRYKLTDVRLFREGPLATGFEYSHRWPSLKMENITAWASPEIKTICITQDYGNESGMKFKVREFIPMEGDTLVRWWFDGKSKKSVPVSNYAIVDMDAALRAFKQYIISDGPEFFKDVLRNSDRLLWSTYTETIRASKIAKTGAEKQLLQMVLQLWVTVRMMAKSCRISGPETLGMSSDMIDKTSPMHGKIPTPPVLDVQTETIITQQLQIPLRTKVLELLQQLTLAQKPSNWFCIYLCTFVLLHNCSLLTTHDMGYAIKKGLKRKHARLDMVQELHSGANVLLAHFHYSCKTFRPFDLDWKAEETTSMAELDNDQVSFVRQTASYVKFNELRFQQILEKGAYDDEHFFIAQLYESDWKPKTTI